MVKNLKVVLGVRDLNYFFFLHNNWLGRGCFFLGCTLERKFYLLHAFWNRVGDKEIGTTMLI